jgi:GNAT superfamily N-acetyltransferase
MVMIRKAQLSDLSTLQFFQDKLVVHERPFDPTIPKEGRVEYYDLKKLIESENVLFLVAEVNNEIVGCCFGEIRKNDDIFTTKFYGYIGLMFVKKENRREGIGNLIINSLLEWFKQKKIYDIRLKVYAENSDAVKAYKKYGFQDFVLELRKEIE